MVKECMPQFQPARFCVMSVRLVKFCLDKTFANIHDRCVRPSLEVNLLGVGGGGGGLVYIHIFMF